MEKNHAKPRLVRYGIIIVTAILMAWWSSAAY